jgi:hypothetical protein
MLALSDVLQHVAELGQQTYGVRSKAQKFRLLRFALPREELQRVTLTLSSELYPCLRTVFSPIPPDCIAEQRKNYAELLPKTVRFKTAQIGTRAGQARVVSDTLGITDVLKSDELRQFGELLTGKHLRPDPGCQIICYEGGDFCGPHNDHHPEEKHLRDGFVDIHIMLSEPTVVSQLLVYEKRRGLLNAVEEVGSGLGIAVYQLPFWHYTTPLVVREGARSARRWVFLASYIVERVVGLGAKRV